MPLPESFLQHLRDLGYHPRSNKHSNALSVAIVEDLLVACPPLAVEAREGRVVYQLNMDLRVRTATWNVDLVLGPPAARPTVGEHNIVKATPAAARIAIELKGVMTEHRKAVKNRKRDLEAHHEHVHNYNSRTIAGGVMVINGSTTFRSPLRPRVTSHGTAQAVVRLVEHCVNEMRNVAESGARSRYGLDAKAVVVVDFDNTGSREARYFARAPAPQPGDPLHYDSFIQKLCEQYLVHFRSHP